MQWFAVGVCKKTPANCNYLVKELTERNADCSKFKGSLIKEHTERNSDWRKFKGSFIERKCERKSRNTLDSI